MRKLLAFRVCWWREFHPETSIRNRIERRGSFDEAAFATLGAVALHGIRTAEAKLGDIVAVIGLGLLGQITVQMLKAAGCRVLGMDIDASRADLARMMGADAVASSPAAFRELCVQRCQTGAGVDAVLITAETPSSEPVNLAGAIARDRAIVVAVGTVGMDIERKAYYEKELDFRISRSYGPGRYDVGIRTEGPRLSHRLCALDGNAQHGSVCAAAG